MSEMRIKDTSPIQRGIAASPDSEVELEIYRGDLCGIRTAHGGLCSTLISGTCADTFEKVLKRRNQNEMVERDKLASGSLQSHPKRRSERKITGTN